MLPRIRADLDTTIAQEDNVTLIEVADPISGRSFRFYDFEYALAQQLNGQPLDAVRSWAATTYGAEVTAEALQSFIEKLAGLGFLEVEVPGREAPREEPEAQPRPADRATGPEQDRAPPGPSEPPERAPAEPDLGATDKQAEPHPTVPAEPLLAPAPSAPAPAGASPIEDENGGGVPLSSAISAELEPLFAGAELVELNSSPWPARLLEGEPADATELPSPLAAFTTGAPSPAPPPTGPEETPIASIAHAIISEGGSAAESRAGDRGAGSNDDAPASRPGGPARRPTLDPPAPVIMPTTIETTRAATAAPPKPASRPAAGPAPSAGAPAPATATTTPPPASSWLNHVREEVEAATPGPAKNFRMPTAPAETGAPARGGASPAAPQLPRRRFPAVLAVALVALAVAAVAWFMWPDDGAPGARTSSSGSVPAVHVMSPQPTVFHRWFSTPGTVVVGRDQTLGFPSAGRIQDVLPPGTTFSAGETIAHLKGTAERELAVNRLRSRIAFLEQLHGSSTEAGNKAAARDAEAKLTLRKRELAMALAELAKLEIRPTLAGAVAEVLVPVGSVVGAHAPVLRLRAAGPRAVFAFSEAHLAAARELTFCRLETIPPEAASGNAGGSAGGARPVDCTLPVAPFPPAPGGAQSARSPAGVQPPAGARTPAGANDGGPRDGDGLEGKLAVDLVAGAALAPGTPVRLASARYENVFPVPREAVLHQDGADRVWVISGAGRTAEMRAVEVASTEPGFALVSRGIRTGEAVIVDPPASLQNGGEVYVAQ